MRIFTILVFLSLFSLQQIKAQDEFDLSDCLVFALNNSPKLQAEKLSQQKEKATFYEQKSDFLPQVDAFINYHNYFSDLPTYIFPQAEGSVLAGETLTTPYPVQLGLPHNLNTGLEINQTIFDMRMFGNKNLNQQYLSYNDIKLSMAEEEMLYQVATLFFQIAVNEERMEFLDMNLERLNKLQSVVKLQVEQGFAKQTDFDKLLVKTSNLQSKKNKLSAGITQQTRYLKLMMGMEQNEELVVNYDKTQMLSADFSDLEKGDILEEKMLEEQQELNRMNTQKLNADYYPKLQAYAAFLFQAQRDQFNFLSSNQDWYNVHQWGLKLSIPIMHGLEKKSKKEISEIVDAQLTFGLEQKQLQGEVEFESAKAELEVARMEQASQADNVALAERVYTQSELEFGQGTMLLMDFLDSEATLRESKMIYATSVLDTRMAELKFLKASGKLKELVNK